MGIMKKIFIVHGWTYTTEKWSELSSLLSMSGYEIVSLTVPGLTEKTDKVWTLDMYVEWLHEKISHEEDPILIGHSNGGRIALAYCAAHPHIISLLVLIGSAGIYHNELPIRIKRAVFGMLAKIGKKLTSSDKMRNLLYKVARVQDYNKATPIMKETMHNLITVDLTEKLELVSTPTLLIWGEKDTATPLSDGLLIQKKIKNSKLYTIKDAGHSPHFTHAKEVAEQIIKEL